ncbi:hypothetical protein MRB53_038639 [Persea americana]|nr:hypothetical protein MRB53_038639 [Persea americana]
MRKVYMITKAVHLTRADVKVAKPFGFHKARCGAEAKRHAGPPSCSYAIEPDSDALSFRAISSSVDASRSRRSRLVMPSCLTSAKRSVSRTLADSNGASTSLVTGGSPDYIIANAAVPAALSRISDRHPRQQLSNGMAAVSASSGAWSTSDLPPNVLMSVFVDATTTTVSWPEQMKNVGYENMLRPGSRKLVLGWTQYCKQGVRCTPSSTLGRQVQRAAARRVNGERGANIGKHAPSIGKKPVAPARLHG